jgi:adenosylhomocysteine nucleosidase
VSSDAPSGRHTLVLAPMRSELKPLLRAFSARPERRDGLSVHVARRADHEIYIGQIGVGPAVAERATERLLSSLAVDHVVVSGIAGGIGAGIEVGDLIVPDRVMDLSSGETYWAGEGSGLSTAGTVATTAELIFDPDRIAELVAQGVVAMDMETAAVAAVCQRHKLGWNAFRVVSDRPQDHLLNDDVFSWLNEDGTANAGPALRYLLAHPAKVPSMVRLGRDSLRATQRAAEATARFVLRPLR